MAHSVTCKLNNDARSHQGQSGKTFFVSLGEKNYNFKTKQSEYTNYEAALFAKDNQIGFYTKALVKDAIIEVSGTGLIMEVDPTGQYQPKLIMQDAKLIFVNDQLAAPQQPYQAPQAPQQTYAQQPAQAPIQQPQQAPAAPYGQPAPAQIPAQAPVASNSFDDFDDDIPF